MKKSWLSRPWVPYVASAAGGFGLAYAIVAVFVFPAGAAQRDVAVPNVIGLPYADAQRQLEQAGFTVQRGESRFHNAAPKGTVLDQQPEPDASAVPGIRVTLALSGGPKLSMVPGVIGLSREQALTELEAAGFDAGDVSERSSNEPRGAVIDSRPRPGTQVPTPSPVALVVSAGPTTVVVPDVVGRPLSDATQLLRQVGLKVGEIRYGASGAAVADASAVIHAQSPSAGSQVVAGTKVDITVGGRAP